ncbi:MAG: LCP family protein [Termitinemataceae bacterium]|nr:MAG: LCP family protein [Termitinemataceae bacterium]
MIKKTIDISLILLISIGFIVIGGIFVLFWTINRDPIEADLIDDRVITSLFIFENGNTPIGAYVMLFYPANKNVAVFEINGEVGLIIDEVNLVDRIDSVYKSGRINPFIREIEKLLALKIRYTYVFTLEQAANVSDILQGVTVFIPSPVAFYNSANSVIFPSGIVKLDGSKLKSYLTFDEPDYDIEQIRQRNQRFFLGFIKRIVEQKDYLNIPQVNDTFVRFVKVNMNKKAIKRFFNELSGIDIDRLTVKTISGNYRVVSGKTLLIPHYDGSLIKEIINQTLSSLTRKINSKDGERVWTVEVLNGTATVGLAAHTAELIKSFGYEVISIGNADNNDYDKTEVINRTGTEDSAQIFADIISCKNIINESSTGDNSNQTLVDINDYEYKADFTLIIGSDFNGRYTQN